MHKITIFILVSTILSIINLKLAAQSKEADILSSINQSPEYMRDFSVFISNTTIETALFTPVAMGVTSLITKDEKLFKNAVFVGLASAVNLGITIASKNTFNRQRPYIAYPGLYDTPFPEQSASLPSGHTSAAFATVTSLCIAYPEWYIVVPGYLWACSVGYSRMNLGVHYPSDVLAGAIVGTGSAFISYHLNRILWQKVKTKRINQEEYFL